jgi:hypothetical protein
VATTKAVRSHLGDAQDGAVNAGQERLADFIRHNHASIVKEWTAFARTRSPASDGMTRLALEDHIVDILKFIAADDGISANPSGTRRQIAWLRPRR